MGITTFLLLLIAVLMAIASILVYELSQTIEAMKRYASERRYLALNIIGLKARLQDMREKYEPEGATEAETMNRLCKEAQEILKG